ncbi:MULTISPECIES: hypothetical protein [unclassified Caballeronia]|uniref:hypothetical protein n=1 Tax=unclassified Caballeronia TaxID=2646786 RepID=UPI003ED1622A
MEADSRQWDCLLHAMDYRRCPILNGNLRVLTRIFLFIGEIAHDSAQFIATDLQEINQ